MMPNGKQIPFRQVLLQSSWQRPWAVVSWLNELYFLLDNNQVRSKVFFSYALVS